MSLLVLLAGCRLINDGARYIFPFSSSNFTRLQQVVLRFIYKQLIMDNTVRLFTIS